VGGRNDEGRAKFFARQARIPMFESLKMVAGSAREKCGENSKTKIPTKTIL